MSEKPTYEELVESLEQTLGIIRKAQERLCSYLTPDGNDDDRECLNDLLYMFDGPEQRAIEGPARDRVARARER